MQLHTDKFEKMTANSRSPLGSKAANALWNQEFAAFAMCMKKLTLLNGKPANQPLFTWRKFRPGIIIIVSIDSERDISA